MSGRGVAVQLVLAAVLVGCGGGGDVAAPRPPSPTAAASTSPVQPSPADDPTTPSDTPTSAPGNLAQLDFVASAVGGGEVRGADHAGEHVVLWMWAPW